MNEPLSSRRITELLQTRRVGHPLILLDSVDSTNRHLRDLARRGAAPGTVVVAEHQTGGLGRRGRTWHSPRSLGLWFSVLLEAEDRQLLSLMAGVAVVLGLRVYPGADLSLRWPNDVYAGSRKIAGILCQTHSVHPAVILGIGVNVNQGPADFDSSLLGKATSLRILKGEPCDRERLLVRFFMEIEAQYDRFLEGDREGMLMQYIRFSDFMDHPVRLRLENKIVTGRVVGLHAKGDLLIESPSGRRERYAEGEIIEVMDVTRG